MEGCVCLKKLNVVWVVALLLFASYMFYQQTYVSYFDPSVFKDSNVSIHKNKTLLLTAEEKNVTFQKRGFDSLVSNLKFWEFNESEDVIYLRGENLLPTEDTSLLFIYNRGVNSYQSQENIIPISIFPYSVNQNDTTFDIYNIDENGTVFLSIQGKNIELEVGKSYYSVWLDGFQPRNIKVENFGLFDRKKFKDFNKGAGNPPYKNGTVFQVE